MHNPTRGPEARRRTILQLLAQRPVRRQADLVARLRRRGFRVTQSSISRDLRELGVVKRNGRYVAPEPAPGRLREVAAFVRGLATAGPHLTVVHTDPGAAQGVALAVDQAGWPEVVGTVAGDDTFFIATRRRADQESLWRRLRHLWRRV